MSKNSIEGWVKSNDIINKDIVGSIEIGRCREIPAHAARTMGLQ